MQAFLLHLVNERSIKTNIIHNTGCSIFILLGWTLHDWVLEYV